MGVVTPFALLTAPGGLCSSGPFLLRPLSQSFDCLPMSKLVGRYLRFSCRISAFPDKHVMSLHPRIDSRRGYRAYLVLLR